MERAMHRRLNVWWVWAHEKEEQYLDHLSAQGIHLEKPGWIAPVFRRDPQTRYVYRLDYQPTLKERQAEYLALFEQAGWEYQGRIQGWWYFRTPWSSAGVADIYTDSRSIRELYRRIRRVIGLVLLVEFLLVVCEVGLTEFVGSHIWHWEWLLWVGWSGVLILLGYGYQKIGRKVQALDGDASER